MIVIFFLQNIIFSTVMRGALLHFFINFNSLWENECNILYIYIIFIFYVLFLYNMYKNLILVYKWCIFTMMNKNNFSLSIFWFCHLCRAMASKYLDLEAHLGKLTEHIHVSFGHSLEVNVSLCAWSKASIYMTVYVFRGQ